MAKKQTGTQKCVECGGTMRLKTKPESLEYKGRSTTIRTRGLWCDSCDEAILDGEALKASERAFLELKAEVDGLLTPAQVAAVRRKLKLSQRRAGEVLGGGPRAFQKYEAGTVAVSAPMSNLLRLLEHEPARLRELENKKSG